MKKRLVKWHKLRDKETNVGYTEYMETRYRALLNKETNEFFEERQEANPDMLAESAGMYYMEPDEDLSESVRRLMRIAKRRLTDKEFAAFELITGVNGKVPQTFRGAAFFLQVSPGRVGQLWYSAQRKLKDIWGEIENGK